MDENIPSQPGSSEPEPSDIQPATAIAPARKRSFFRSIFGKALIVLALVLIVATPVVLMTDLKYSVLGAFLKTSAELMVVDSKTGTPVPDAGVTLRGKTANTNAEGKVKLEDLKTGSTEIKVTAESYKQFSRTDVLKAKPNSLAQVSLELDYTGVNFYSSPVTGLELKKNAKPDATTLATIPYLAKLKQISFTSTDFYKVEYNNTVGLVAKSQALASDQVYEVGELSIRFIKPTAIGDLAHTPSKYLDALGVAFTSPKLKEAGFYCTYNQAELGALTKDRALITSFTGDNRPDVEIKKIGEFYLYYNEPSGPCGKEEQLGTQVTALRKALTEALRTATFY